MIEFDQTHDEPETPRDSLAEAATAANTSHDAIQAFLQRTDIDDRLRDVDKRLERLEGSRNTWLLVLAAFVAGVVVVVAAVWIMSLIR